MSDKLRHDRAAIAELERLYAQVPRVACTGGCAGACGPIPMSTLEAKRLRVVSHVKPRVVDDKLTCGYLSPNGRCTVYAIRPLICRIYGALEMLSCPRGCVPERWLTPQESLALNQAVERIGGPMGITTRDGFEVTPEYSWCARLDDAAAVFPRTAAQIAETSAETRSLRALHGGRIQIAIRHE